MSKTIALVSFLKTVEPILTTRSAALGLTGDPTARLIDDELITAAAGDV